MSPPETPDQTRSADESHLLVVDSPKAERGADEVEKTEAQLAEEALGHPAEIPFELLDQDALKVVRRLRQFGHEAYFVGGSVRDLLVNKRPKDFDVATSALPNEVRNIFRNCRLIGRRFRLAHVYFKGGKIIEVSTFRANPTEVEELVPEVATQEDMAHPVDPLDRAEDAAGKAEAEGLPAPDPELEITQELEISAEDIPPELQIEPLAAEPVTPVARPEEEDLLISDDNVFGTAEQDARRRDFTINGLFFDVGRGEVIDFVRGKRDLALQLVRTIGDPEIRLREDPVRILRAVRFASKLGFEIESRTYAAMEGAVEDLQRCAPPRLLEDTFRLVRSGLAAPGIKLLSALDALKVLLPPIDAYLKQNGKPGEELFYSYAEALDERVKSGETLEDAVLLATLLVPVSRAQPAAEEGDRPSVAKAIEDLLSEFVRVARLPRRIAERCRMILLAQRTLTGERKRRGSSASFKRHPLFAEALTVFEIMVEATGEFEEQLEAWQSGPAPEAGAAGAVGDGAGRKRKRRRRRGRGGAGGPGGGAAGAGGGSSSPPA